MILIKFEIREFTFETWFLLVHWVSKNSKMHEKIVYFNLVE